MTRHFKERLKLRFGRCLSKKQQKTLINQIKAGSPHISKLAKKPKGAEDLTFYIVKHGNQYLRVLYSPLQEKLITVTQVPGAQIRAKGLYAHRKYDRKKYYGD